MLGGLWRLYKGVAIVVFTLELGLFLWVMFPTAGANLPFGLFVGATPSPTARPSATAAATPRPTARPTQQAARPGATALPAARFTVEMSENEVNTLLDEQRDRTPGVKDLAVRFRAGRVDVEAVLVDPISASVQASGTLVARDGKLRVMIQEAQAGPLPLPRQIVDLLEGRANAALDDVAALRNVYVEGVEIVEGKARVSARGPGAP